MDETDSQDISVFVVWSPQLGGEERHVPAAAALLPDPRVRHYWDEGRVIGRRYAELLGLGSPAWDVWLLFERDAEWKDPAAVPEPSWWEHQLGGLPDSLRLDPERFGRKATELLRVAD